MEMRVLIFRGKTTSSGGGRWVEGGLIIESYGSYELYNIDQYYTGNSSDEDCKVVIEESLGQYTGVVDKNGKKVFEKDIVKHSEYGVRAITWGSSAENGLFQDMSAFMYDGTIAFLSGSDGKDLEVIGNIYDNPELSNVRGGGL